MSDSTRQRFRDAGEWQEAGLLRAMFQMLGQNKKYWMIPIVIVLLVFGLLMALGATAAAPLIYQLF